MLKLFAFECYVVPILGVFYYVMLVLHHVGYLVSHA